MPVLDTTKLIKNRVDAIREFCKSKKIVKAELDLSGGIDSAVMLMILEKAMGKDSIILVHSNINTNPEQTDRAVRLAKALNVPLLNLDLNKIYKDIVDLILGEAGRVYSSEVVQEMDERIQNDPRVLGSLRSCLRAPIGRACNRIMGGGLRHGTGNKCEDEYLRFYQKGGDGEVDTNPIGFLSKTEVYQLAWALAQTYNDDVRKVIYETINALPSPDLWANGDGHSDEDEIYNWLGQPLNYGRIDANTGKVVRFGTIEICSIALEKYPITTKSNFIENFAHKVEMEGIDADKFYDMMAALVRAESETRHKENDITMLGERRQLVQKRILTNSFNEYWQLNG